MALLNSSKFESDDNATAATATAAKTAKTADLPKVTQGGALATAQDVEVLTRLKNALPVEYNTLAQVKATAGNFVERESKLNLGDTIVFDVLSFQDSWVVSPGDDKAPVELIKYSDDGKVCKDGTVCLDWLADLKAQGWTKAKLHQRAVVVGAIQSAAKTDKMNGELIQFDLSPQSRIQWTRYMANVAYGLRTGTLTSDRVTRVKASTESASMQGKDFTLAKFSVA